MMKNVNFSRVDYKDWVGLSAAPIFWLASLVCFVLGLSFKTDVGLYFPRTTFDITIIFSIALGFANTAIQIVGNDTDREELGMALFLMWGASYMLGIGSNVNFLYGVIGLTHPLLQFLVCWGLGMMIEVAPERLLVKFLRSAGILENKQRQVSYSSNSSGNGRREGQSREERHSSMRQGNQNTATQQYTPIKAGSKEDIQQGDAYQASQVQLMQAQMKRELEKDVPEFLKKNGHKNRST